MRPPYLALVVLALMLAAPITVRAQKADAQPNPPATAPAETVQAFRYFVPKGDVDVRRVSEMVDIARAKQVQAMGLAQDQVGVTFGESGAVGGLSVRVRMDPSVVQPQRRRAEELATKIMESVEEQLREYHLQESGLARAEDAVRRAERELDELRNDIPRVEDRIRQMTGRADASVEAIRSSVPKLDDERQSLKLKVVGAQARQKALADAINRLAKAAGARAQDDPVATELAKVVNARELTVERLRKLQADNSVSVADIDQAEVQLAEARARMLERRETVKQANGGELLAALNKELAMLSIDIAEAEARLAATEKLLAGYVEVQEELARSDDLRRRRERAENALERARDNLSAARGSIPEPVLRITKSGSTTTEEFMKAQSEMPSGSDAAANSPRRP